MAEARRGRGIIKFVFWAAVSAAVLGVIIQSFQSGQMASWYYYRAGETGYAIDADSFDDATPENPALLEVGRFKTLEGRQAVRVRKGARLPRNANGVITDEVIHEAKRAALVDGQIRVSVPAEIKMAKGFKFRDTFQHKGIRTYGGGAIWNVLVIFALGIGLGYMAEGFTDAIGIRLSKIRHFEGH